MNYQKELEKILARLRPEENRPRLLLHCCCAPCSSYVLEYLSRYFSITADFYNPNISPRQEHDHRAAELRRLIGELPLSSPVLFEAVPYEPQRFAEIARGLEDCPEGGERCLRCYRLRLEQAARRAKEGGFDWFTTTLTISPLKNAARLNQIGAELAEEYGVRFLPSDFKKREGYKRSIELSKEYGLYRQDYCGCAFSRAARESELAARAKADSPAENAGGQAASPPCPPPRGDKL
ncbi:epoxyqueuosine reductase QueH [Anaerofilum sp. BX8]|uniref:Epoxyqueuosine reductase QueH n=1 Tax=Anaerofilum hominis TaxID=2763016 RepID=A0A923KUY7_9FIRM|nr:epoxyqueuosine reductase QueH [Anaerofilum hominis]